MGAARRRDAMDWRDMQQAKMTEEIGLKQPVEYTEEEKRTIATHEAGHAVVAHLVGQNRKLEVLSIIKRRDALGLLAHSDNEERYTRTRSELLGSMKIAFGGMTAEELFFGESGTGPGGDLAHATRIAAQMVGVVRHGRFAGLVRGRRGRARSRRASSARCSPTKTRAPGGAPARPGQGRRAPLLDDNRHLVIALRDELLDREELVGDEIIDVLHEAEKRHRLETAPRNSRQYPWENTDAPSGSRW